MSTPKHVPNKKDYSQDKDDVKKSSPEKSDSNGKKEETKRDQKSQGNASQGVVVHQNWFHPVTGGAFHVVFPRRSGNSIIFYKSSKDVFAALEHAIRTAKKSVDIITMGIDTDFRLTRNEEYRKVLRYSKVYPATVDREFAAKLSKKENDPYFGKIADPDVNSSVFSDLITRRAVVEKAIVARMIVGVPRQTIGNTFHDPLHLWWRSKSLPEYKDRIRFALREAKGVFIDPSPLPSIKDTTDLTQEEREQVETTESLDYAVRLASTLFDSAYQFMFTHHQKLYLIDIEDQDATGFVIGSNLNEDYWDDSQHMAHNMNRYPYRAWHDSGLQVKGPVLFDIAKTFEEAWSLLTTQETLPPSLHNKARLAQARGLQLVHDGSTKFIFPRNPSYTKETPSWGVKLPGSPEYYKPHADANEKVVEAQFTRTFSQEGAPKDFSTHKVLYRAVKQVRPGGIIYIENQYFRDLILMKHLTELGEKYSDVPFENRPRLIILTNDPFLNEAESAAAAGPTFMAYKMLKQCGLPFLFCKLETLTWPTHTYAAPRY